VDGTFLIARGDMDGRRHVPGKQGRLREKGPLRTGPARAREEGRGSLRMNVISR